MNKKLIAAILCSLSIAFLAAQYGGDKSNTIPASATPTFSYVQGALTADGSSSSSLTVNLASNPVTGHPVLVALVSNSNQGLGTLTVKDSAATPNVYTLSTQSVMTCTGPSAPNYIALAYLLSAPASATKTITASWTGGADNGGSIWADEFSLSSGSAVFDNDASQPHSTASGTNVNTTPSLTPAVSGELFYAVAIPNAGFSAPTGGTTLGVWTGGQGGTDTDNFSTVSEYSLSVSTATPIHYTDITSGDDYCALMMGFKP